MQLIILIPSLVLFLYFLYHLVKDDYVFIRKNLSPEQVFDIVFLCLTSSIFFSRLIAILETPLGNGNPLILFLSFNKGGFSLLGGVFGAVITLFLIAKIRKLPFGRLFDYIALAVVCSFPLGFISEIPLMPKHATYMLLGSAGIYLLLAFIYRGVLYPRLLNRSIKEGILSSLFLLVFSCIELVTALLPFFQKSTAPITLHLVFAGCFFLISFILLLKQAATAKKR